jgi:hypothetical protein
MSKGAALHARPALDAGGGLDRELVVPFFDLFKASRRDLIQIPDHPPDLDPLETRETVLAIVDKNDTSRWSSLLGLYSISKRDTVKGARLAFCSTCGQTILLFP